MKAISLHAPGPEATLVFEDRPAPTPGPGEVLVEVRALAINPVDVKICDIEAVCAMICGGTGPLIPGWDVAGTIVEAGSEVTDFEVGDRVFGMIGFPGVASAYAEKVTASANHLARIPDGVSFEDAAATTLAALTALQVLRGRVNTGDRVLIHAASGGVGHFAIQLAKSMGAHVIATCSAKNRDFVLGLGADEHIDYRTTAFQDVLTDIDLVIDALGGDTTAGCVAVAREGGRVISLPSSSFEPEVEATATARNVDLSFLLVNSNGDDMRTLARLLSDGTLRAHVSQTFDFADMAAAHQAVRSGRTVGKVVVRVP